MFRKDDLVEMRGHGDGRRFTDHFISDSVLAIGFLSGQVQRSCHDANRGISLGKIAAEILEMSPIIPVESLADLWAHIAERERGVHCVLTPFSVCGRNLVTSIVARTEVVGQFTAKHGRDCGIFNKDTVFAVCVL